VNPWGIIWDRWGQTFETDGAGFQGMNYAFPGAAFESAVGVDRVLPGMNPRSPKYCSEEILSGRHIPDNYQGDILTNDFRANRIVRFKLSDNGAGYTSRQMPDFLTSTDTAFRPVDIKMGPDGAIYIADWYNPIIQHGEVDFRDPRRDHVHGRIWRVTAKDRSLVTRPKIAGASIDELLELLKAPEDYTRHQAKLELRERKPQDVMPALKKWVASLTSNDSQSDHHRLEALWTCENLDIVDADLLTRVLKSNEPRARAAAVRVLGHWSGQLPDALKLLEPIVNDDYPRVRLEAVRAAACIPTVESMKLATRVLDKPLDPVLEYALWLTCNDLASTWIPAFEAGRLGDWNPAHRNYALRAVKSPAAMKVLVQQLKSSHLKAAEENDAIDLIADIGGPEESAALLDLALNNKDSRPALLGGVLRMATRKVPSPKDADRMSILFDDPNESVQTTAMRLAGAWKITSLREKLISTASAEETPDAKRAAAIDGLARMADNDSRQALRKLSAAPTPAKIRRAALAGLAAVDMRTAVRSGAEMIKAGDEDPAAILAALLSRENAAAALTSALSSATIPTDTAKLSLRYLQGSTTQDPKLMAVFSQAVGSSSGPTKLTAEQMKQMTDEVLAKGNAEAGERVFRRADTNCYQCHSIAGAGGFLAPDLSSIGATAQLDYLVNSVLDPGKDIKDGYDGFAVVTKSGDVYSGIKVLQDSSHLVLRDNTHPAIQIPLSEVKNQKSIGSLMPTGLADPLTHQEFLDLIKFLSQLGKPGPYGPSTAQVIRKWELMPATPDANSAPPTDNAPWTTAYSLFNGTLPPDVLPTKNNSPIYARAQIDVTSPGKIQLLLGDPKGVTIWIDNKSVEPSARIEVDLPRGVHMLLFKLDPSVRGSEGLRAEVTDAPGSPAHAIAVGGR